LASSGSIVNSTLSEQDSSTHTLDLVDTDGMRQEYI
jgi:hypothetical protein